MKDMIHVIIEDLISYNGKSALLFLYFVALVIVWRLEKQKRIRSIFVLLGIATFLVFINPVFAWVGTRVDLEIYYRMLWTLPIGLVVCYAMVLVFERVSRIWSKIIIFALCMAIIVANGKYVYKNTIHFKASNPYHIPNVVIHVADALELDNMQPTVIMPAELLPFIKEYSGELRMPYGRNMLESAWTFSEPLYDAMESEKYDIAQIAQYAKQWQCFYVVLSCAKEQIGDMKDYNYAYVDFIDGYYIYMDREIYQEYSRLGMISDAEQSRLSVL